MLLDRKRVKTWQKWVFAFMALIMFAFILIPVSGQLGCAKSADKQLKDEITDLQERVAKNSNDVDALRGLGDAYQGLAALRGRDSAEEKADLQSAAGCYQKAADALAADKSAAAVDKRVEMLRLLAGIQLRLNASQEAVKVWGQIAELKPKDAAVFADWGDAAVMAQDTRTALLAYTRFLELDPKSPRAAELKTWMKENAAKAKQ